MKIKKKFTYRGIELQIVERDEPYLNSGATVKMIRVMAPNGGAVPLNLTKGQTLKSIQQQTIEALNNFEKLGANTIKELTNPLKN